MTSMYQVSNTEKVINITMFHGYFWDIMKCLVEATNIT